ncbi:MAG: ECF transporter S component [Mycoplasmataceae bacterium]|nr:ECF transporter S component [Mycoplasmataceae bacterium]
MWNFWKNRKKTWTNKKIAFVAILVATSVAFVLVFTRIAPIASLPSFKLMAGGLPIKLTGYIFGPLIGAVTGALADVISFTITPTYIHWWYTLAFAAAGAVPGIVGYLMNRRWKKREEVEAARESKYSIVNFIITLSVLGSIFVGLFLFIALEDSSRFADSMISNKWAFLAIATSGVGTMLIATIVFRFVLKPKTFNAILPIIVFSALLEVVNTPLVTMGDIASWDLKGEFLTVLTGHLLLSPLKIWGNMIIILIAYKIVSPLIYNKSGNGWEEV